MNKKFFGFVLLGTLVTSLLGAGIVYAATVKPKAIDKKQLGLFSGSGDFIGTVLNAKLDYTTSVIDYTVYNSSLDAFITITLDPNNSFTPYVRPQVSQGQGSLLYFSSTTCTGNTFLTQGAWLGAIGPNILQFIDAEFFVAGLVRYYMNNTTPATTTSVQSYLDQQGNCSNLSQTINGKSITQVTFPFTLTGPLTTDQL